MFSALRALPLTVSTAPGESASSFASRLAWRNGVPRLITFCSDVGIDYFRLVNGDPMEIERLAVLGGVDETILQDATPTLIEPGWFRLGKERIKFTGFIRTTVRICPKCVAETPDDMAVMHHGLWQLSSIRTCAKHGCYLVSLPKPSSSNDSFDHIGLLRNNRPGESQIADQDDLELERYLMNRVRYGPGKSWLDRLPFHVAAQTCEMFGVLLTSGPKAQRAEVTDKEWSAAGTAGIAVLLEGPRAMQEKLKSIQNSHPVGEKLYRSHYRVFFDWLRYRDDDNEFDAVRDVVRDFIFKNFPVTEGSIVLGKPCPEQHVHSFSTAKQVFDISHHRLGRKLTTMGMAKLHPCGKFYTLEHYIPTTLLSNIVAEVNMLLSAKEAAKIIGIDGVVMARLASHGLIAKHSEYGERSTLYHREDLKAFLGRLRDLAKRTGVNKELIDISTAARRRGVTIASLTEMILKQRIPLYINAHSAESFRAFRLRPESLKNIYGKPKESVVSSLGVAKILKTTRPTVYRLNETGFLKSPKIRKGRWIHKGHYTCRTSLEEFQASYISLNELTELSGRSNDDEFNHQLANGVIPLPLGLRSTMMFRRSDVTSVEHNI